MLQLEAQMLQLPLDLIRHQAGDEKEAKIRQQVADEKSQQSAGRIEVWKKANDSLAN